jgi:acylphosphatase
LIRGAHRGLSLHRFSSLILASSPLICNTNSASRISMVLHYLIKGRVQGVGFRWFVHREAAALGLKGWVRNTEDGHVEVVAEGELETLAELEAALRKGSRGSRVDAVIEHELAESEGDALGPFQIEGAW